LNSLFEIHGVLLLTQIEIKIKAVIK